LELLLEQLILFGSKWTWETLWSARNIFAANETREFKALVGAGQFVEDTAESDEVTDASDSRQWRLLGAHGGHPAEDVIAVEQCETGNLGVVGGEIAKELTHRGVVGTSGS